MKTHLNSDYNRPVRDPLWKHIYLSEGLYKIIGTPVFQKLTRIKQLGPTYHVYPGATHTRFNHSLGVFHISWKIMSSLDLGSFPVRLSVEGIRGFLCASLLHDLGHFPYAHSLKELPLDEHEHLSASRILGTELKGIISDTIKADPAFTAAIIDQSVPDDGNDELVFFRNILSGVLDPDKLDYLNRDAFFCGVPYGIQDIDFVISKMRAHDKKGLAVTEQGLIGIENILFSKYMMYKTVYWHKAVRIATAMIKKAILLALSEKVIDISELYGITDEEFFLRFSTGRYEAFRLIEAVNSRQLYKTAFEAKFLNTSKFHSAALCLTRRLEMERDIAADLGLERDEVIIDIPEPISFEVNVPVVYDGISVPFTETDTVFKGDVVKGFSSALRKVRIFVPERSIEKAKDFFGSGPWKS
ncbi:MAG: HD domain-containing protein [Spirochaetales bacterium]|nr:HD domain-containing protein [Spirochaetales bacterium]